MQKSVMIGVIGAVAVAVAIALSIFLVDTDGPVSEPPAQPTPTQATDQAESIMPPTFDVVRVNPEGNAVMAGRAHPGSTVEVLLTITAIRDETGEVVAHLSNAQDITEKKQIERSLTQQDKLFSVGLLASGIAHEIGSPLNVISGRAEMVKQQLSDQPELSKSLDIIIQQTDRISELVRALLNFSRPTTQDVPATFALIDLKNVVEECGKLFHKPLLDQGVSFHIQVDAPGKVVWNFFKCQQVFVNLLQNALHAVEDTQDPRIDVLIRAANEDEKKSLEQNSRGVVTIEFRDNGEGIEGEHLGRVFDPFFTTKDIGMGTGLGLSVVYGLVEEVDGHISVQSEPGRGTVFKMVIPSSSGDSSEENNTSGPLDNGEKEANEGGRQ